LREAQETKDESDYSENDQATTCQPRHRDPPRAVQ